MDSVSKRHGSDTADVRVTFTGVAGNNKSGLVSGETLVQGVDYDVTAAFTRTTMGEDNNVTVTVTLKDTETYHYQGGCPGHPGADAGDLQQRQDNIPHRPYEGLARRRAGTLRLYP